MQDVIGQFLSAIFYGSNISSIADLSDPADLQHALIVSALIVVTAVIIWFLKGRSWAFIYVALIPALNWSFGNVDSISFIEPNESFPHGVLINPLTMVTGLVLSLIHI